MFSRKIRKKCECVRGLVQHWEPLHVVMAPKPVWESVAKGDVDMSCCGSEMVRLVCWGMFLCSYALPWMLAVGGDKICLEGEWARTCQACVLLGQSLWWELCGTAFKSALITCLLEKLPVLYFSFKGTINGFLYCRVQAFFFKSGLQLSF